ncbi:MAG: aldo/keto reductase [Elusimicrobia bacterium]|nr:aldo/keto reductase [Elusimicrobiota bacterium]MDE2314436.1 aldo/keto reductase [Elusimicrobiota bacterium]
MTTAEAGVLRRPFGRTGLSVSEIGFGGWGIGKSMWGRTDDAESLRALHAALDCGINYFDTAFAYGHGHSEKLIAKLLKDARRAEIVVSTKIPPKNMQWPARPMTPLSLAFPPGWIVRCVERSLRNLGAAALQLEQFHVWTDAWLKDPAWPEVRETIARLKKEGKILHFGASLNSDDPESGLKLVGSGFVDQIQVLFNLFDQRAADRLFPLCREKGVAVVVRCPFDEGGLTGALTPDIRFEPEDFRSYYFAGERLMETCRRVQALKSAALGPKASDLITAALKYCLSFPSVSTVIPGMRRTAHVLQNAAASDGSYYGDRELKALAEHRWVRDFYR